MIFKNDNICYMNVYSKISLCHYEQIGECMEAFLGTLKKAKVERRGNFFYSLNQFLEDGTVELQMFQPAKEYCEVQDEKVQFLSYYYVDHMLSTVILEDFDKIEWKYAEIMKYMENNHVGAGTNFYNEICKIGKKRYVIVKIGAAGGMI